MCWHFVHAFLVQIKIFEIYMHNYHYCTDINPFQVQITFYLWDTITKILISKLERSYSLSGEFDLFIVNNDKNQLTV